MKAEGALVRRGSRPGRRGYDRDGYVPRRRLRRPAAAGPLRADGARRALGGAGAGFAEYARGGVRAGPRQRRDRAGLQHARLGHRRAERGHRRSWPTRSACRPRRSTPATSYLGRRGQRQLVRGGDERTRRRLPAVPADHRVRAGRRRLPHQGRQDVLLRRRARGRVPGRRPQRGRPVAWCRSSWCRPATGCRSRRPGTRWACARPRSHDLHVDVTVPAGALLGGVEGLALVVAQLVPHWMVASYAAVYVGVARAAVDAAVEHVNARKLGHLPAIRARIGPGRRRGGGRAAGGRWRRPGGSTRRPATPRPTGGCGAPSCSPARPRPRWPRRCWRRPAPRRCAAAIRWSGSTATRACGSLQPATSDVCADWLGVEALGGDPESEGSAPRWYRASTTAVGGLGGTCDRTATIAGSVRRYRRRPRRTSSGRASSPQHYAGRQARRWPSGSSPTRASGPGRRRSARCSRTSPTGPPSAGCAATRSRRCRSARRRSAGR